MQNQQRCNSHFIWLMEKQAALGWRLQALREHSRPFALADLRKCDAQGRELNKTQNSFDPAFVAATGDQCERRLVRHPHVRSPAYPANATNRPSTKRPTRRLPSSVSSINRVRSSGSTEYARTSGGPVNTLVRERPGMRSARPARASSTRAESSARVAAGLDVVVRTST